MKIRRGPKLNNPYPQSGHVGHGRANAESAYSFTTAQTRDSSLSLDRYSEGDAPPTMSGRSIVTTLSTEQDRPRSIIAPSHVASSLNRTVGGGVESRRGGDSTFSSPSPSIRSLATTLTTIQSLAQNGNGAGHGHGHGHHTSQHHTTHSIHFSQPFPTASPASAIPAHLAPNSNPTTYSTATANNLLTDNASILTLASSSKRRRRRSMDTDASVRALAPSSLWGGSRESLPLSVLSGSFDPSGMQAAAGIHGGNSRLGAERNSIYSATGVAPAIPSDRTSLYTKQGDGASIRSGRLGHGRPDSISGSIAGLTSPLSSPQEEPDERFIYSDRD